MPNDSSTQRLAAALRAEVTTLRPGDRLRSTRSVVEEHGVSPVTVSRALAVLAAEGLVVTRPGAGTYVAQLHANKEPGDRSWQTVALGDRAINLSGLSAVIDPPLRDGEISLALGYLHSSLVPARELSMAWARSARVADAWMAPPAVGLHGLRAWFAQHAVGGHADAADVLITTGGQSAISTTLRALVPADAPLLLESPTYPGALAVARAAHIRSVPVPTDSGGVIPELLAEAFARTGAQAVYLQPAYANPTGVCLTPQRRAEVLEAAATAGAFVIEDDYAHWLAHDQHAPSPLIADDTEGRVVYITSLTKTTSPNLRIGAVIARGPVADRLRAMRVVDDLYVPRPVQEAAIELVSRASWPRHLQALSQALQSRGRTLADAVSQYLPRAEVTERPRGGMHLWVRLPNGIDDGELTQTARRAGVLVMPGRPFFPADAPGPHLRLTFSAAASEADLATGVRRLASVAPELG